MVGGQDLFSGRCPSPEANSQPTIKEQGCKLPLPVCYGGLPQEVARKGNLGCWAREWRLQCSVAIAVEMGAVSVQTVVACNGAKVVQWGVVCNCQGGRLLGQGQSPPLSFMLGEIFPVLIGIDAIANNITQLSQGFSNTGWKRRTWESSQKRSPKIKVARKNEKRKKVAVQQWLPLQDLLPGSRRRLLGEKVASPAEIAGEDGNFREPALAGGVAGGLWLLQS